MNIYSFKASKRSPFLLRGLLFFFVTVFGVYTFSFYLKQISIQKEQIKPKNMLHVKKPEMNCDLLESLTEETHYMHFPQPKTFSRGECACTPVRFFVILSMQRSGSGWFETLLNSHPNISSNGEIFSVKERRSNISSLLSTLDALYNLDWYSSAAKNECVAAVGFKWMLNQAVMDYHREVVSYFNWKGVSVIFLFRRNLLRRLISVLANEYDRDAKLLNGTHKSHVHLEEEAKVLESFKPTINTAVLIRDLSLVERKMADSLQYFNSTRHVVLFYEDLLKNKKKLSAVQRFLGVPVRKLKSRQVKIHTGPSSNHVENWEDVYKTLKGTQYERFLDHTDFVD